MLTTRGVVGNSTCPVCTRTNLKHLASFLRNKELYLLNVTVTVYSVKHSVTFECCQNGYACDMRMVCLVVQLPPFLAPARGAHRAVDKTCRPRRRRSAASFLRVVSTRRARRSLIIIITQALIVTSHWVRHDCHPTHSTQSEQRLSQLPRSIRYSV